MENVDHLVIGGGVMGSAAAWQLARRGRSVVLLERFEPGHVQGASHGASRIYRQTYDRAEYLDLTIEALGLWRELEDATGSQLLTITGGVSHGAPAPSLLAAFEARGIAHEVLTPAEAPSGGPACGSRGPSCTRPARRVGVHADRAVLALQSAATSHGADVRHGVRVLSVTVASDGVLVETSDGPIRAGRVVLAVGAWTAGLLGRPLPLVVTQEQPAHFDLAYPAEWPSFTHQPLGVHPYPSGTYGLLTPGEGVKVGFHAVGPVTDPDHRSFTPEPAQLALLQRYAEQWMPGVDASSPHPISCTYTTTPDHDFILDRRGPLVVAAGFSGHGFKFGPAIGRVLADLADEPVDDPVRASEPAFHLSRPVLQESR